jgi:uncharacterized membrane-anchored protein
MGELNGLLQLLIYLLIGGLIVYAVYWILGMLSLPLQARQIVSAIVAIIVLIWLLATFVPGLLPA